MADSAQTSDPIFRRAGPILFVFLSARYACAGAVLRGALAGPYSHHC
jgi:hypothetical protein